MLSVSQSVSQKNCFGIFHHVNVFFALNFNSLSTSKPANAFALAGFFIALNFS